MAAAAARDLLLLAMLARDGLLAQLDRWNDCLIIIYAAVVANDDDRLLDYFRLRQLARESHLLL